MFGTEWLLTHLSSAENIWKAAKLFRLDKWAMQKLNARSGVVIGFKFDFFASRTALIQKHPTLAGRLIESGRVDSMWVSGSKFYRAGEGTHRIKRLLLPHCAADSFIFHSSNSNGSIEETIIADTSKRAIEAGPEVKYTPIFLGYSINLVDTNSPAGWAHVELVLPFSKPDKRPSFTVYKYPHPDLVNELQRVYDELWKKAVSQPSSPKL